MSSMLLMLIVTVSVLSVYGIIWVTEYVESKKPTNPDALDSPLPAVLVRWSSGGSVTREDIYYHATLGIWVTVGTSTKVSYQLGPGGGLLDVFTDGCSGTRWVPWCTTPQEVVDLWYNDQAAGDPNE